MEGMSVARHKLFALIVALQAALVLPLSAMPTMQCADGTPCGENTHAGHACCQKQTQPATACHEPVMKPHCVVRPGQPADMLSRIEADRPANHPVPVAWVDPRCDTLPPAAPALAEPHPELIHLVFELPWEVRAPRGPPAV